MAFDQVWRIARGPSARQTRRVNTSRQRHAMHRCVDVYQGAQRASTVLHDSSHGAQHTLRSNTPNEQRASALHHDRSDGARRQCAPTVRPPRYPAIAGMTHFDTAVWGVVVSASVITAVVPLILATFGVATVPLVACAGGMLAALLLGTAWLVLREAQRRRRAQAEVLAQRAPLQEPTAPAVAP